MPLSAPQDDDNDDDGDLNDDNVVDADTDGIQLDDADSVVVRYEYRVLLQNIDAVLVVDTHIDCVSLDHTHTNAHTDAHAFAHVVIV